MSQLRDHLRHPAAGPIERDNHIQFIQPRHGNQCVAVGNPLALQQELTAGIPMYDAGRGKQRGKLPAPPRIVLDNLHPNAAVLQLLCQVIADSSASADNGPLCLVGDNPQIFQKNCQCIRKGSDENPISFSQHKVAVRRHRLTFSQHGADQRLTFHNAVHLVQGHIAQFAPRVNPQFHDLHPPLGKRIALQKSRILQKSLDLGGGLFLRIHRHGQGEHLPHGKYLVHILRIAHPGNGMNACIHGVGRHTAQQVYLICARHGDQQVGLFYPRLLQHRHRSTVSLHHHNVITLLAGFQYLLITVNQRQVISFCGQLTGQRSPHLAVSGNYYLHGSQTSSHADCNKLSFSARYIVR